MIRVAQVWLGVMDKQEDVCITEHCFDANFARNPTAAVIVLGSGLKFLARTDLPKLLTALIAVR